MMCLHMHAIALGVMFFRETWVQVLIHRMKGWRVEGERDSKGRRGEGRLSLGQRTRNQSVRRKEKEKPEQSGIREMLMWEG